MFAARGHPDTTYLGFAFEACLAAGFPTLIAVLKLSFIIPHDPPCPEHLSMTFKDKSGIKLSISADF